MNDVRSEGTVNRLPSRSLPFRFPFSRLTRYLVRLGKGTEGNVMRRGTKWGGELVTDRSSRDERGRVTGRVGGRKMSGESTGGLCSLRVIRSEWDAKRTEWEEAASERSDKERHAIRIPHFRLLSTSLHNRCPSLPLLSPFASRVAAAEPANGEKGMWRERNLWMVDFIMDFMGFFCYFHNKIHNKSTYKIIKNNKCRNDPKNPNFIIYKTPK